MVAVHLDRKWCTGMLPCDDVQQKASLDDPVLPCHQVMMLNQQASSLLADPVLPCHQVMMLSQQAFLLTLPCPALCCLRYQEGLALGSSLAAGGASFATVLGGAVMGLSPLRWVAKK